jgi:6-phospho-3-hexuloisomerase
VNIRGVFRDEAIEFLKEHLGERLNLFTLLDDSRGWMANSLDMLESAKHDYIFVWNEDHINTTSVDRVKQIVSEMKKHQVDYLLYSWWMFGRARNAFDKVADDIGLEDASSISYLTLTEKAWNKVRRAGYPYYLISMCGIFHKDFLREMWQRDQFRIPNFFKKLVYKILYELTKVGFRKDGHKQLFDKINRHVFLNKIRKFPKETPFEMEKSPERADVLPIVFALPREEFFACIDDNLGEGGYSLIERELYKRPEDMIDIKTSIDQILTEIKFVLSKVNQHQVDTLVKRILSSKKVIASGAGRVGMAVRGFVMRLKHLGLDAYILGDANVPALRQEDLFLVCSGSGETQTIYELTRIAQKNQAHIGVITGNPESRIGKMADTIVQISAPSKTKQIDGFASIQPMTTLNEQSLGIFFDALVLRLMQELGETHETMWARHSNLE